MPDRSNERWVAQLPSTASIKDQDVRNFLDTLKNAWELRSGDTGASEDARFITKGEFEGQTARALGRIFSREYGGAGGPGFGGDGGGGRFGPSNRELTDNLANWVVNSDLYRRLNTRIQNLEVPYDTIDRVNSQVANMRSQLANLLALIGYGGSLPDGVKTYSQWLGNTAAYAVSVKNTVDGHTSQILSLQTTTGNSATSVLALQTLTGQHTSQITTLLQTTATNATSISNMQVTQTGFGTRLNNAEGQITEINRIDITSTSAAAQNIFMMQTTLASGSGPIGRIYWQDDQPSGGAYTPGDRWVDTNSNPLYQIRYWNGTAWQSGVYNFRDYVDAGITTERNTRVDKDTALARAVNTLWAFINNGSNGVNTQSIIEDGALAIAGQVGTASATQWTSLQSAVLGPSGTENLVAQARQDFDTYVNADNGRAQSTYTVRVNANGNIAGFGLQSTYTPGAAGTGGTMGAAPPASAFGVVADSFWIAAPGQASVGQGQVDPSKVPFVALTSPATIDGKPYPAGVFIRTAFIAQATIDGAQIGDLQVDTLQLAGSAVTLTLSTPGQLGSGAAPSTGGTVCALSIQTGSDPKTIPKRVIAIGVGDFLNSTNYGGAFSVSLNGVTAATSLDQGYSACATTVYELDDMQPNQTYVFSLDVGTANTGFGGGTPAGTFFGHLILMSGKK